MEDNSSSIVNEWIIEYNCQCLCKVFIKRSNFKDASNRIVTHFDVITGFLNLYPSQNENLSRNLINWLMLAELCFRLENSKFDSTSNEILCSYISALCKDFKVSSNKATVLVESLNKILEIKSKNLRSKSLANKVDREYSNFLKKIKVIFNEIMESIGPSFLEQLSNIVNEIGNTKQFTRDELLELYEQHNKSKSDNDSPHQAAGARIVAPKRKHFKKLFNPTRRLELSEATEVIEDNTEEADRIDTGESTSFCKINDNIRSTRNSTKTNDVRGEEPNSLRDHEDQSSPSRPKSKARDASRLSLEGQSTESDNESDGHEYFLRSSPLKPPGYNTEREERGPKRRLASSHEHSNRIKEEPCLRSTRPEDTITHHYSLRSPTQKPKVKAEISDNVGSSTDNESDNISGSYDSSGSNGSNGSGVSDGSKVSDGSSDSNGSDASTGSGVGNGSDVSNGNDVSGGDDDRSKNDADNGNDDYANGSNVVMESVVDDGTTMDTDQGVSITNEKETTIERRVGGSSDDEDSADDVKSREYKKRKSSESFSDSEEEKITRLNKRSKRSRLASATESEGESVDKNATINGKVATRTSNNRSFGMNSASRNENREIQVKRRTTTLKRTVQPRDNRSDEENVPFEDSILEEANLPSVGRVPKKRRQFSQQEVNWLKEGVKRFGVGKWRQILESYGFISRTSVNLKDKWRNLVQADNA